MSANVNNKSVVKGLELGLTLAIQGLETALPQGVTSLTVGKVTYSVPDLIKMFETTLQPWTDARAAHAVLRMFTQGKAKRVADALAKLADLKMTMATILGRDGQDLVKFGFKPQKARTPLTSEQRVLRAAKSSQTRDKHHTLGSRQKAALGSAATPSVAIASDGTVAITPAASAIPAPPPTLKAAV